MSATATSGPKQRLPFSKKNPRRSILLALIVFVLGTGGLTYFIQARRAAAAVAESAPQTATVRQGNLVISASGTGTLTVSNEVDLSFATNGQVTGIFVKPGDFVEVGTLLAQLDDQGAQTDYAQAKHTYQELTSAAAIASAQAQVAQAQSDLLNTKYDLEYLIGPEVFYWETEIAKGEQMLEDAKKQSEASPNSQEAQQALQRAKDYLGFAQDKLKDAWELYYDEYVPDTFRLLEDGNDKDIYDIPTDLQIQVARTAIEEAQKKVNDS